LTKLPSAFQNTGARPMPRWLSVARKEPEPVDCPSCGTTGQVKARCEACGFVFAQVGDGVVEDIFSAYFLQGRDVGSRDELLQIAQRSGLEAARVTAMWDAGAVARDVAETEQQMRALDISGVPFFILERKLGVSGAQAPEALMAAIRQASN